MHKINETFEKSYLLTGLSKFAQTFAVRFLKSSSIHPICINASGSFSFVRTCISTSSGHEVLNLTLSFELILMRFELVF